MKDFEQIRALAEERFPEVSTTTHTEANDAVCRKLNELRLLRRQGYEEGFLKCQEMTAATAVTFFKWMDIEVNFDSLNQKYYIQGTEGKPLYTVEELFDRWDKKYNHGK